MLQTFAWPALLAAITLAALVLGLVGEGPLDAIATAGLAVPVAISVFLALRGRNRG